MYLLFASMIAMGATFGIMSLGGQVAKSILAIATGVVVFTTIGYSFSLEDGELLLHSLNDVDKDSVISGYVSDGENAYSEAMFFLLSCVGMSISLSIAALGFTKSLNSFGVVLMSSVFAGVIFPIIFGIIWGGNPFFSTIMESFEFSDFGGGTVIFLVGGCAAFTGLLMNRSSELDNASKDTGFSMGMFGLWLGVVAYGVLSNLIASDIEQAHSVSVIAVNIFTAGGVGMLVCGLLFSMSSQESDALQLGLICGLVSASAAILSNPAVDILTTCILSGSIAFAAFLFHQFCTNAWGLDINPVVSGSLVGGALGSLCVPFQDSYISFEWQFWGVGITIVVVFFGSYLSMKTINKIIGKADLNARHSSTDFFG